MTSKIKVYELAREFGKESQELVDVIQHLGIDIKNPMSVIGSEEVKLVREYFKKSKSGTIVSKDASLKGSVTEKRVGATVIRRRAAPQDKAQPATVAENSNIEERLATKEVSTEKVGEPVIEKEASGLNEAADESTVSVPKASSLLETKKIKTPQPIIKKVGTEEYLGEKVGPKVEKKTPETVTTDSSDRLTTPKRVKEIELTPDSLKDARKKVVHRQDSVFRTADFLKREIVYSSKRKKPTINRPTLKTAITKPADHKRVVTMTEAIQVGELAHQMGVKSAQLIAKMVTMGVEATINQAIDFDTAVLCAHEFGFDVKNESFNEEAFMPSVDLSTEALKYRPPVVTVMGHVDHGKTSLLDAIRKSDVVSKEAGGITQHVGAYTLSLPKGRLTFIDTPGHEAFTSMRARGAKVTDIVVLVVSAVEGVMPQTLEAISHAKAGGVPMIVAVNKVDLPDGNPDRIKQTLAGHGLNPEEWGGDTQYVSVSAKTGKGIDTLCESILLQAEILELKANYETPARGHILESELDKNRGPIASVLVSHGKLKVGDVILSGVAFGKIRAMNDSSGQKLDLVSPSEAVRVLGFGDVPNVGDEFCTFPDEKSARAFAEERTRAKSKRISEVKPKISLEEVLADTSVERELRVILKTDVQGSLEAIRDALLKFPQDKVKLKIVHSQTGGINESDVMLAVATKARILGFNIRPDLKAQKLSESEKISIDTFSIIYELMDAVKGMLLGLVQTEQRERVIGRAEVRSVFSIPKIGTIAGSQVTDGKVMRGCFLRLLRDSRVIYDGKISSLRRFKDDVKEVALGFECGIGIENFNDIKMGDHLEAYLKDEIKGTL